MFFADGCVDAVCWRQVGRSEAFGGWLDGGEACPLRLSLWRLGGVGGCAICRRSDTFMASLFPIIPAAANEKMPENIVPSGEVRSACA